MIKLRRILLQGIASDEKLYTISRYARMLIEQLKRDPKIRDLAVAVTRGCRSKEYVCEASTLHYVTALCQGACPLCQGHSQC